MSANSFPLKLNTYKSFFVAATIYLIVLSPSVCFAATKVVCEDGAANCQGGSSLMGIVTPIACFAGALGFMLTGASTQVGKFLKSDVLGTNLDSLFSGAKDKGIKKAEEGAKNNKWFKDKQEQAKDKLVAIGAGVRFAGQKKDFERKLRAEEKKAKDKHRDALQASERSQASARQRLDDIRARIQKRRELENMAVSKHKGKRLQELLAKEENENEDDLNEDERLEKAWLQREGNLLRRLEDEALLNDPNNQNKIAAFKKSYDEELPRDLRQTLSNKDLLEDEDSRGQLEQFLKDIGYTDEEASRLIDLSLGASDDEEKKAETAYEISQKKHNKKIEEVETEARSAATEYLATGGSVLSRLGQKVPRGYIAPKTLSSVADQVLRALIANDSVQTQQMLLEIFSNADNMKVITSPRFQRILAKKMFRASNGSPHANLFSNIMDAGMRRTIAENTVNTLEDMDPALGEVIDESMIENLLLGALRTDLSDIDPSARKEEQGILNLEDHVQTRILPGTVERDIGKNHGFIHDSPPNQFALRKSDGRIDPKDLYSIVNSIAGGKWAAAEDLLFLLQAMPGQELIRLVAQVAEDRKDPKYIGDFIISLERAGLSHEGNRAHLMEIIPSTIDPSQSPEEQDANLQAVWQDLNHNRNFSNLFNQQSTQRDKDGNLFDQETVSFVNTADPHYKHLANQLSTIWSKYASGGDLNRLYAERASRLGMKLDDYKKMIEQGISPDDDTNPYIGPDGQQYGEYDPADNTTYMDFDRLRNSRPAILQELSDAQLRGYVHAHELVHAALHKTKGIVFDQGDSEEELGDAYASQVMGKALTPRENELLSKYRERIEQAAKTEEQKVALHNLFHPAMRYEQTSPDQILDGSETPEERQTKLEQYEQQNLLLQAHRAGVDLSKLRKKSYPDATPAAAPATGNQATTQKPVPPAQAPAIDFSSLEQSLGTLVTELNSLKGTLRGFPTDMEEALKKGLGEMTDSMKRLATRTQDGLLSVASILSDQFESLVPGMRQAFSSALTNGNARLLAATLSTDAVMHQVLTQLGTGKTENVQAKRNFSPNENLQQLIAQRPELLPQVLEGIPTAQRVEVIGGGLRLEGAAGPLLRAMNGMQTPRLSPQIGNYAEQAIPELQPHDALNAAAIAAPHVDAEYQDKLFVMAVLRFQQSGAQREDINHAFNDPLVSEAFKDAPIVKDVGIAGGVYNILKRAQTSPV